MASVMPAMPPPMMATWKSFFVGDIVWCGVDELERVLVLR